MSFNTMFQRDTAVAETTGGTETEAAPSIASLIATQGRFSTGTDDAPPEAVINTEKKEEKPDETKVPDAASANETPSAVQGDSETQTPKVEEPKVEALAIPAQPAVQQTWQEVLKAQQPETVFKELGYDEKVVGLSKTLNDNPKMIAFFEQWASNGDLRPYLKALTTDYSKMGSEELMRHQLLDEYPDAEEATINALYQRKVVRAYDLDSNDADEEAEGKLLLDADAKKVKEGLISKQQQFLMPKPQEPKPVAVVDDAAAKEKVFEDNFKRAINDSPLTKGILNSNQFVFGEGADQFKYKIEKPQEVIDILLDKNKWASLLYTKEGDTILPHVPNQMLLATILHDPNKFFKQFADHFKSVGSKEVIDPIDNASIPNNSKSSAAEIQKSIAAQMATAGKIAQ